MNMLKAHMDAMENNLVALSQIPANAGHPLHKGTPREAFIKEYLEGHLGADVAIGTGEIIDANSQPRNPRRQFDIVIYKKNFPKLSLGGGISCFLIESVIATIEVKSILDQAGINQAVSAARESKNLITNTTSSFYSGWVPPKILNYVVAYSGPSQMETVHNWIQNSHKSLNIPFPQWNSQNQTTTPGTALDGVFVLKKGFVILNNVPLGLKSERMPPQYFEFVKHIAIDSSDGNLLWFFILLQLACNAINTAAINMMPYLTDTKFENGKMLL